MMMRRLILLFPILFFLAPLAVAQQTQQVFPVDSLEDHGGDMPNDESRYEHILSFHSDISIATDGTVAVSECIRVYAAGEQIRRGIVRRIPEVRKDIYGRRRDVGIEVVSVTCNGQPSEYRNEREGDMRVVYVGSQDVFLDPGFYDYVISYTSRGHIGFFDGYDELYWNVTGNDWDFQIDQASATVAPPAGAALMRTACYTGTTGSTASDCVTEQRGDTVVFRTTTALYRGEGLSVAVAFPPGIITRPPPPTTLEAYWMANSQWISPLICLLILFVYCFLTWRKVGRDPEKPVVVPEFRPPHDWTPAVIRYLYKRAYDDRTFTAALVSMGVKGALRIEQDEKNSYRLHPTGDTANLSDGEETVYQTLFPKEKSLRVDNANRARFADANTKLNAALDAAVNLKDYYLKNINYVAWGAFVTVAVLVLYILLTGQATAFGAVLFLVPLGAFLFAAFGAKRLKADGCAKSVVGCLLLMPVLMALAAIVGALLWLSGDNPLAALFTLAVLGGYGLYIWLIKAPTQLGAKTRAEIEGFRMYLKTAEEQRLNLLTPPEHTPELFERMLPYAIALEVENAWGKKFDSVLRKYNYVPDWYEGATPFAYYAFSTSFASSLTSSVTSARQTPDSSSSGSSSWSSGSGGGGFSGGGGGGGGGGGW